MCGAEAWPPCAGIGLHLMPSASWVLITGANRGLGYVTAKKLVNDGESVIVGARSKASGKPRSVASCPNWPLACYEQAERLLSTEKQLPCIRIVHSKPARSFRPASRNSSRNDLVVHTRNGLRQYWC